MTPPRPPGAPAQPLPPDAPEPERRRAILHAAVRVFAEKGYHGCRIADVARDAGVAYGLVYHYFRNKDELLESVFAEQWALLLSSLHAIEGGAGSASERIAAFCGFVMDVYKTAPAAVRVLILEVTRTSNALRAGTTPQTYAEVVAVLARMVRQGQEAGELRRDVEPAVAAAVVLGAVEMALTGLVMGVVHPERPGGEEIDAVKRQVVGVCLAGLAAPRR